MSSLCAVVDRIENGMAVLLVGADEFNVVLPLSLLPPETAEGTVLRISVDTDPTAAEDARRRVGDIINRLSREEG